MILTIAVTVMLLWILAGFGQPGWFWRVVLLFWWVTTTVHGWWLARRAVSAPASAPGAASAPGSSPVPGSYSASAAESPSAAVAGPRRQVRRRRILATGTALAVLAAAVAVAVDARRIEAAAADAHRAGDCESAVGSLDRIAGRHRVVDPYLDRRTGGDAEACGLLLAGYAVADQDPAVAADQLRQYVDHPSARWDGAADARADILLAAAEADLDSALAGTSGSLAAGFDLLAEVLATTPGRAEGVTAVLEGYVAQLPTVDPCHVSFNLDWLADREATGDELDRAGEQADQLAPSVYLACGDQLLDDDPS